MGETGRNRETGEKHGNRKELEDAETTGKKRKKQEETEEAERNGKK